MSVETYGRYQLLKKLATGGMAQIFLARQVGPEGFEKMLVVKRILPHLAENEDFITMFLDEARIAARLNHPNIVQIFDLGAQDDTYFIAMEFIHGEDVRRVWRHAEKAGEPIPLALICRIIIEACAGLDYAHKKADASGRPLGIVHRDISPQNILVSFEGGVKVVDFGIAKAADQATVTRSGVLKGKYSYMSPEQAAGQPLDCRTDIFALGVVLYELLTGTRLFKRATDIQTLNAVSECVVAPPSEINTRVPRELDAIVMRALAREREGRFPEARQLGQALEAWLLANGLPSSSGHLAEFMHRIYADRLAQEAEEGRLLVETLDGSRGELESVAPERATPTGESPRRPTRSLRATATPHQREPEAASPGRPGRTLTDHRPQAEPRPPEPGPAPRRPVPQPAGPHEITAPTQSQRHRRAPLVGLGVAGLGALVAAGVYLAADSPRDVEVRLESTPPGASVVVEEQERCLTPCAPRLELPVTVEFRLAGHVPVRWTLTAEGPRHLAVPLEALPEALPPVVDAGAPVVREIELTLHSEPEGALVMLDGARLGATPLVTRLAQRREGRLTLEAPGYEALSEHLVLGDDAEQRRAYTLRPLERPPPVRPPKTSPKDAGAATPTVSRGTGTVRFVVKPWATVECGAYKFGDTPFPDQAMAAGEYRCTFTNPELGQKTQLVRVVANQQSKVSVTFEP